MNKLTVYAVYARYIIQFSAYSKTQLEMSRKTVVDQKDDETALNSYCLVFENGIKFGVFKFRAIFCLRVLNFVNFLKSEKSRNLILAKIRKNKVVTESLFVFSCDLS